MTNMLAPHLFGVYQMFQGRGQLMSVWSHEEDARTEVQRLHRDAIDGYTFTVGKFRVFCRWTWCPQFDASRVRFTL
jgi:hypothetical protein